MIITFSPDSFTRIIIPGSTLAVLVTLNTVSAIVCEVLSVSCGKIIVFVKKPCSLATAVSEPSIAVIPNKGAEPFGIRRVIIPAKLFFARSWVKLLVLKIPVTPAMLFLLIVYKV